jgi:hypothetical protein
LATWHYFFHQLKEKTYPLSIMLWHINIAQFQLLPTFHFLTEFYKLTVLVAYGVMFSFLGWFCSSWQHGFVRP